MEVKKVGVLGSGIMGMASARYLPIRYPFVLWDIKQELVDKCMARIGKTIAKAVEKGQLGRRREAVLANIKPTTDLKDRADVRCCSRKH
jgi:3-hydroxybutyryl-CoA dehydrogenase